MFQFIVAKLGVRFIPVPSELKFFFWALKTENIFSFEMELPPLRSCRFRLQRRRGAGTGAQPALALASPSLRRGRQALAGS